MSASEADRFISDVQTHPEQFREFERLAAEGRHAEAYAATRSMGYDATSDEIRDALMSYLADAGVELDEQQLAAVAGGISDAGVVGLAAGGAVVVATVALAAAAAI